MHGDHGKGMDGESVELKHQKGCKSRGRGAFSADVREPMVLMNQCGERVAGKRGMSRAKGR